MTTYFCKDCNRTLSKRGMETHRCRLEQESPCSLLYAPSITGMIMGVPRAAGAIYSFPWLVLKGIIVLVVICFIFMPLGEAFLTKYSPMDLSLRSIFNFCATFWSAQRALTNFT
jgi:hypothetical protein